MPRTNRLSAGAIALLQEPQLAHLATLMQDGTPQITPVWVDVEPDGRYILINTAATNLKLANIRRNPHVGVSVVDKNDPYRHVCVRGTMVEETTEGADAHIDALSQKYIGHPYERQPGQQRVIIRIQPHHVMERSVS